MRRNTSTSVYKIVCLIAIVFSVQAFGQQANSALSTEETIAESVRLAPCKEEERLDAVRKLFAQMGVKDANISIEKYNKDKISNVVVRKKGKSDETIVIGAHYDKTGDGCGAIDNWTGVTIVAHLLKTLQNVETEKSYVFVAFDQEEKGLLGSDAMAKTIPKENRGQYCAMVNFDSFGFAAPMVLQNASSSKMISIAKKLGKGSDFKLIDAAVVGADADSSSFKNRGIPSITFGGLDGGWQNYLHTKNDKIEKINMTSVYYGYRFGLMFVAKLDATNCQEIR